jgi:type I site-specific restriction endonuclease
MNQSSKKIRPYQEKAVSVAVNLLTHGHKKVLLELSPGSGKTFIVTELVKRLLEKGFIQKVLILTSTRMAADLFTSTFNNLGPYKVANEFNINGLPWQTSRNSALLGGVGKDAEAIVQKITG